MEQQSEGSRKVDECGILEVKLERWVEKVRVVNYGKPWWLLKKNWEGELAIRFSNRAIFYDEGKSSFGGEVEART